MLDINTLNHLTDLAANTLYSAEVAHLPKLSREEEVVLIERACEGDSEAREQLIISCLSHAFYKACFVYYARRPRHDDLLDLAQEASLQMVKGLDLALTKRNPASYLCGIAHKAISIYCTYDSGLIKKPRYNLEQLNKLDQRFASVGSLDAPLYNDEKRILVTLIEAPATPIEQDEEEQQKRHTTLYKAISRLSRTQQEVIIRLYGLFGQPMETHSEIGPSNLIHAHAAAARKRLQVLLEEV